MDVLWSVPVSEGYDDSDNAAETEGTRKAEGGRCHGVPTPKLWGSMSIILPCQAIAKLAIHPHHGHPHYRQFVLVSSGRHAVPIAATMSAFLIVSSSVSGSSATTPRLHGSGRSSIDHIRVYFVCGFRDWN